jgi:hypothetical protein
LDKGNELKEGHGGLPRRRICLCVWGEKKIKMRKCEERFLVLMCGKVFMERVCARI